MRSRSNPRPPRRVRAIRSASCALTVVLAVIFAGSSIAAADEPPDLVLEARARLAAIDADLLSARSQGLAATRSTLELPVASYGYAPIVSSLRACAPAETTAGYVNASAWCRGCAGGAYLTGLVPLVRADPAVYAART